MSNRIKAIERLNNNYARKFGNPTLRQSLFRQNAQKVSALDHRIGAPQQPNQVRVVRQEVTMEQPRRSMEIRNVSVSQPQQVQSAIPVVSVVHQQNVTGPVQLISAKSDIPGAPFGNPQDPRRNIGSLIPPFDPVPTNFPPPHENRQVQQVREVRQVVNMRPAPQQPQVEYLQTREQVQVSRNWPKLPKPLITAARIAPAYIQPPQPKCQCSGCPLWVLTLLTASSLLGLVACLAIAKKAGGPSLVCSEGFVLYQGKCYQCKDNSVWNGTHCVRQKKVEVEVVRDKCNEGFILVGEKCVQCPELTMWNGSHCVRRKLYKTEVLSQDGGDGSANQTATVDDQKTASQNQTTSGGESASNQTVTSTNNQTNETKHSETPQNTTVSNTSSTNIYENSTDNTTDNPNQAENTTTVQTNSSNSSTPTTKHSLSIPHSSARPTHSRAYPRLANHKLRNHVFYRQHQLPGS